MVSEAVACRAPMRAIQITDLSGPDSALELVDVAEPEASHPLTPGEGVVVEVRAAGVAFPEVLQTRGEYQVKPPLPFVPGSEVAGVVRSATPNSGFEPGDRVAAGCMLGGFAEVAVAPPCPRRRRPHGPGPSRAPAGGRGASARSRRCGS